MDAETQIYQIYMTFSPCLNFHLVVCYKGQQFDNYTIGK